MKILKKLFSNFAENKKAQINETQVSSNTKKPIRQSPLSLFHPDPFLFYLSLKKNRLVRENKA